MAKPWEQYGFKELNPEEEKLFYWFGEDHKSGADLLYKTRDLAFKMTCSHAEKKSLTKDSHGFHAIGELYHDHTPKIVLGLLGEGRSIDEIFSEERISELDEIAQKVITH